MKSFRLVSYNICSSHFLHGHYTRENLEALAATLADPTFGVICLQEVDKVCTRSEGVDMTAELAALANYPYTYFIKIRDFQGGEYGTAILSRYPIIESKTLNFPVRIATQGTSCGYVVLDVNGEQVTVFNTHLSVENDEANTETMLCLGDILCEYMKTGNGRILCCGDFNTNPDKIAKHLSMLKYANSGLHTYADRSIDNVLYLGYDVQNVHTRDTTTSRVTDHNMLICDVVL
jgi:endonuclease/exonuclease/phosphatase family metal-dependent hydrolase